VKGESLSPSKFPSPRTTPSYPRPLHLQHCFAPTCPSSHASCCRSLALAYGCGRHDFQHAPPRPYRECCFLSSNAVSYLSEPPPQEHYPFSAAREAMGLSRNDMEARRNILRAAIWARLGEWGSSAEGFDTLFSMWFRILPAEEPAAAVRKIARIAADLRVWGRRPPIGPRGGRHRVRLWSVR
jgi:hypothetical protein